MWKAVTIKYLQRGINLYKINNWKNKKLRSIYLKEKKIDRDANRLLAYIFYSYFYQCRPTAKLC